MQLLGKVLGLKGLKLLEPPVCTSFKEKQWSTWFYPIQTDVSYQHAGWNSIHDLLVVAPAWLHPQAILAAATLAGNVKALHWKGLTESSKKWRKIVWFLTIQGLFTSQPKTAEILSFPSSVYIPSKRRLMEKNALLSLPFINSTSLTCSHDPPLKHSCILDRAKPTTQGKPSQKDFLSGVRKTVHLPAISWK